MALDARGSTNSIIVLCRRSADRVACALVLLFKTALRPTTQRAHRFTALLLLGSVAAIGLAAFVGYQLSTATVATLCVLGAAGLLLSGVAGTQLDATAHHARPGSGDFPMMRP